MTLIYKDDWDEAKQRYQAWWHGEYIGRCALWVTAARENAPDDPLPEEPEDPVERWTDLDCIAALNEHVFRHTYYGGEAYPIWHWQGHAGLGTIGVLLGCPVTLDHESGWHAPILSGDDWDVRDLKIDKGNYWWRNFVRYLKRAADEAAGKSIPGLGGLGCSGDELARLRGSERLLLDLVDRPGRVREAEQTLMGLWLELHSTFYELIRDVSHGGTCVSWFPIWAPGKFRPLANDFAYMISPKMYREIFLPTIQWQSEVLDYCVYHVDGPGNFNHVPALCQVPRLQALQILPGAGNPSPLYYAQVLKMVQAAGKNLHITLQIEKVEPALRMLSAKGLFIQTQAATEAEARDLLEKVKVWSQP